MIRQRFEICVKILVRAIGLLGFVGCFMIFVAVYFFAQMTGDGAPTPHTAVSWRDVLSGIAMLVPPIYFAVYFGTSFAKQKCQVMWWGIAIHLMLAIFNYAIWGTISRSNQPANRHAMTVIFAASLFCTVLWWCMYMFFNKSNPITSVASPDLCSPKEKSKP